MPGQNLDYYLLQDGTHAAPGACALDDKGVLRHTDGLAVCTYEDGTPQTVGQDAINNKNVHAANPAGVITALEPASCTIGGPDFTLKVVGKGFTTASTIYFAGHDEPTTFNEGDGSLSTGVKPALWSTPTTVQCSVRNSGTESNAVDFEFLAQGATRTRIPSSPPKEPAPSPPKATASPPPPKPWSPKEPR